MKIQRAIEPLKTKNKYHDSNLTEEFKRIQCLLDRFEYIKAYVELRQYMLKTFEKQFDVWMEQGKLMKIWLAEMMSLQERLHSTACDSEEVIRQLLKLQMVVMKESKVMEGKLDVCKASACELIDILKEIRIWSEQLQWALHRKAFQNGTKTWNDVLIGSIMEEMEQIARRFSAVINISECFCFHLEDLLRNFQRTRTKSHKNNL
ncbi:plectin-like [Discoglossus pictus]